MSDQRVNWDQIKNVPPFLQERDSLVFEAPNPLPDGITANVFFVNRPKQIVYQGVFLFEGFGYNVINAGTPWQINLLDVDGTVITPRTGDVIRAQTR